MHKAGYPHLSLYFDMTNAFACSRNEERAEAIGSRVREEDVKVFERRYNEGIVRMETITGEVCVAPGSGGLMGDRNEPDIFGSTFARHIETWQQQLYSEGLEHRLLFTRCPVTQQNTDLAIAAYVDVVSRKVPVQPGAEQGRRLAAAAVKVNEMLTAQLALGGFAQNVSKQVAIVRAVGLGGMAAERDLLGGGPSTCQGRWRGRRGTWAPGCT